MSRRAQSAPSLEDIEVVFAALGHEVRRHIVLLLSHLGGELPSGWLAARFQHSWPTTTRHLNVLESAGIVEVRREGRSSHYRLKRERLDNVLGGWMKHLTPSTPETTWEPTGPRTTSELEARRSTKDLARTPSPQRQHEKKGRRR